MALHLYQTTLAQGVDTWTLCHLWELYHFPSQCPSSRSAEITTGNRGNVAAEIASIATRQKPQSEKGDPPGGDGGGDYRSRFPWIHFQNINGINVDYKPHRRQTSSLPFGLCWSSQYALYRNDPLRVDTAERRYQ